MGARNVVMFLSSVCILGSFEKHIREAAVGWQGHGWGRSVTVIMLYCISFFLTLLNTPMDDMLTATYLRIPKWYRISAPSAKFLDDLGTWHTLNTIRLICAILAWLVLSSEE